MSRTFLTSVHVVEIISVMPVLSTRKMYSSDGHAWLTRGCCQLINF